MNRYFIRCVVILLLSVLAVGSVRAQSAAGEPVPSTTRARADYDQAEEAENSGDFEEAIRLYGLVIDREPDFWAAYYRRGVLHSILENYDLAVEDYNHVIELEPDYVLAYDARAVAHQQLGNYNEALDDANRAIELGIEDDYVFFTRAMAHLGLTNYQEAINDFTYWIDLNPKTYAIAYFYRSRAYYAVSNLHSTISDLDIFLELQPESASVLADRGYIYRLLGDYDHAIEDYSAAIALEPEGVERVYFERGQTYALQGDYPHMLADLRAYAEIVGDQADPAILDLLNNHPE
ncbi:MAG: tetratricopeptide repeat protein [Chloroflexi bacterium]|nr:tetratricopeptide repeat protein [Chloroflexota bacterium]MCC6896250.1 tetratricopeptide repeat protein [Anaerolineae bacterium]